MEGCGYQQEQLQPVIVSTGDLAAPTSKNGLGIHTGVSHGDVVLDTPLLIRHGNGSFAWD